MSTNSDDLRVYVYDHLVASGLPPTLAEIAAHFGTTRAVARQGLSTLKIGKTILVHPESGETWMAGPFSAAKTDYQAVAGDRSWWANCAWDMLGIPMVLNAPVRGHTKCTDCGKPDDDRLQPFASADCRRGRALSGARAPLVRGHRVHLSDHVHLPVGRTRSKLDHGER